MSARGRLVSIGRALHHGDVGIAADIKRAFLEQPKMPRRIAREKFCRMGEWKLPFLEAFDEQRVERLESRHARRIVQHFCIRFAIARPADMVGRDNRHVAGRKMLPQKIHFGP